MLSDIKNTLLNSPDYIKKILEHYDFCNVSINENEIRCGFDENSNRTSIRIRLKNNDKLFVTDFKHGLSYDLFTFIIKNRNIEFTDLINYAKRLLNITIDIFLKQDNTSVFGGFYDNIKRRMRHEDTSKVYGNSILNQYVEAFNKRFYDDGIDFETQKYFNLMFDVESQRIVIPIYNSCGELIGIKGRANWDTEPDEQKYYYLVPCRISETLYGYSQNYQHLTNNTIYIAESEKSVMQAFSMGYRNFVSIGGNTLSTKQCLLLMELLPQKIIFLLDEGLDRDVIKRNIHKLSKYTKMTDVEIGFWDYELSLYAKDKCSPTDLGKDILQEIINNEIVYV